MAVIRPENPDPRYGFPIQVKRPDEEGGGLIEGYYLGQANYPNPDSPQHFFGTFDPGLISEMNGGNGSGRIREITISTNDPSLIVWLPLPDYYMNPPAAQLDSVYMLGQQSSKVNGLDLVDEVYKALGDRLKPYQVRAEIFGDVMNFRPDEKPFSLTVKFGNPTQLASVLIMNEFKRLGLWPYVALKVEIDPPDSIRAWFD